MSKLFKNLNDPVIKNMLNLLRYSFNNEEELKIDLSYWKRIKEELNYQTVLPLVINSKLCNLLPNEEKNELLKTLALNMQKFHLIMREHISTFDLLKENNIPAVVIKGAGCSQYYKNPSLRVYGDIDILINKKDLTKAHKLLVNSGYEIDEKDSYDRHQDLVTPNNVIIELHQYFSDTHKEEKEILLDDFLVTGIKNRIMTSVGGYEVPTLPPLENGLVILGHIKHHIKGGLGLRQIIDWMNYVSNVVTDKFYEEEFKEKVKLVGMESLAKITTRMCQKYLGLSSEIKWCKDVDDKLVDTLLLYILNKGNFGRRISQEDKDTADIGKELTNPIKAFKYLVRSGCVHMEERGLKPHKSIAWLYQIGHISKKAIKRKNKKEVARGMHQAAKNDKFFNEIEK